MRGYGQFCPVAKAAEVFAERWTPLIIRGLAHGSHHFNQLEQELPRISRSLLASRLKSLQRDGVIERRPNPEGRGWLYYLTPAGEEFVEVITLLGAWGQRWAVDNLSPDDLDPRFVLWAIHRRIRVERLPARRLVVRFDFRGLPKEPGWLILNAPEVEVCIKDPGWEPDVYVNADIAALANVHLGRTTLAAAMRHGLVEVDGPRQLVREFPTWLGTSPFARFAPSALAGSKSA